MENNVLPIYIVNIGITIKYYSYLIKENVNLLFIVDEIMLMIVAEVREV